MQSKNQNIIRRWIVEHSGFLKGLYNATNINDIFFILNNATSGQLRLIATILFYVCFGEIPVLSAVIHELKETKKWKTFVQHFGTMKRLNKFRKLPHKDKLKVLLKIGESLHGLMRPLFQLME